METKAVITGLIGFFILYGGLACCIGIAWYHNKNSKKKEVE